MLTILILKLLVELLNALFGFLPYVTLADIPLYGEEIRETLVTYSQIFASARETLPYMQIVWDMFCYVIIPFEIGLLILKLFLGDRTPQSIR